MSVLHINQQYYAIVIYIYIQTSVMFNMITTGLDREHFSNPYLFNPDRWDKKTTEDNLTFTSLPFGFGPRMCYGKYLLSFTLFMIVIIVSWTDSITVTSETITNNIVSLA